MKTKITLAEIGEPTHSITLMVDSKIEYGYLIDDCISSKQARKLEEFEDLCMFGWYSVYGHKCSKVYYGNVYYDGTEDETGRFKTGYRVYVMANGYLVQFLTNIQGQRDKLWIIPESDIEYQCVCPDAAKQAIELCKCRPDDAFWSGDKIQ